MEGTNATNATNAQNGPELITIDVKQLNSIVRSIVSEVVAGAVTDIRKGQASIVDRIGELSNAIMSMKNSLIATNQVLADLKPTGGRRAAIVYVNKNDEPAPCDLFGNITAN